MALTTSEAGAVNTIASHLLQHPSDPLPRPHLADVRTALELLTLSAHRRLHAGWMPGWVKAAPWRDGEAVDVPRLRRLLEQVVDEGLDDWTVDELRDHLRLGLDILDGITEPV